MIYTAYIVSCHQNASHLWSPPSVAVTNVCNLKKAQTCFFSLNNNENINIFNFSFTYYCRKTLSKSNPVHGEKFIDWMNLFFKSEAIPKDIVCGMLI